PQVAITFIGLESALGLALILYEFPQWLIPISILFLIGSSALILWSTSSGKTEDCGCYGGVVIITPKQSILLNLGYILLLVIAWLNPISNYQTHAWKWILALMMGISASILGWQSQHQALIDFSRLKIGNTWKRRWLKNSPNDLQNGTHFIVFLSKDCPYCKRWVPFLNMMNTQKDLPQVMGIMSITNEELAAFQEEQIVRFPLISMDKLLFSYMADAYPTAVLIENGVISSKWVGEIPPEFLDRIKQLYEQLLFKRKESISS
ncbi:MAG TPA: MauE/DoxX family redox-associated membrane protein, partial [Nostocaceae cyanobacterium]|nr:MauE/DoxX family redox-associated membrane protein [Nostocaceae cyanobacterium]